MFVNPLIKVLYESEIMWRTVFVNPLIKVLHESEIQKLKQNNNRNAYILEINTNMKTNKKGP